MLARLRWGAAYPLYAVALSAALLLVVSLSIALQPPSGAGGTLPGALEWAHALFFTGGVAALALSVVGYARPRPAHEHVDEVDDVTAFSAEPEDLVFTLIAVRLPDEAPAAIADFTAAADLLAAMSAWRRQHPDEELRVFGPGGVEIARRPPAEWSSVPAPQPAAGRSLLRRRVSPAMGGV